MKNNEKRKILVFAKDGFEKFYAEHSKFIEEKDYKPGKKTYRNLLSLNKMMYCYINTNEDYIIKTDVISKTGWVGSSSYVQHERIITNFGMSDTSWEDTKRPILLLNNKGKKIRDQYKKYAELYPSDNLREKKELPDFAIKYLINEIKETNSHNMTLWKNTIITALYLYCELEYIPMKTKEKKFLSDKEKYALIKCCNYVKGDGAVMDLTYMTQPITMLKNLKLLNSEGELTVAAYKLLKDMKIFREIGVSIEDYENVLFEEMDEVEKILDKRTVLEKVEPPSRKKRKSILSYKKNEKAKNKNFDKLEKENKIIGNLGEKLVLEYEKDRLRSAKVENIDDKVFLTSEKKEEYGNAYPCDIISYDEKTGNKLFIEVKTTRGGAETPFFISADEVAFSEKKSENYRLYRVFNMVLNGDKIRFYETFGDVRNNFSLKSDRYVATRYEEI